MKLFQPQKRSSKACFYEELNTHFSLKNEFSRCSGWDCRSWPHLELSKFSRVYDIHGDQICIQRTDTILAKFNKKCPHT